ncbi:nucleotide-diphospho-sugar transferase [Eremomyces bilateralis CBS 781.70]|uniref:Mannose-1-phosphate guanyltransferase n=1 Tax=Eremomyces bilateralis CBS 781.70 TaxID=1392243 RepID=A0A6G1FU48_9PEZI|nr:nucleotide-diphospho-sugar transferase [Eremomyces bilateralis CBS 781.70]KAF1809415.1 nucleotide-diphospho-sugar transferase [Eremomyces bilateralis CBS 781.70]
MGPKAKKGGGNEKSKSAEEEREDPLQAVVLADAFETRFQPFTVERPRCLITLANTPLIHYTLEFLANAGVEEVYVYCGSHKEQVEDYINTSKWNSTSSPFSKLEIIRSTSRSVGDAMRDLDKRNILVNDFIIVYGDLVSNVPLEAALAEHRARRAKDPSAIMTMVLREAGRHHRTKAIRRKPVFVMDRNESSSNRCLHYEEMHSLPGGRYTSIDEEILTSTASLDIRGDLIDCGIDICTPDVIAQWSDNFDWEVPRSGFLYGVLKDYELNGKTIHVHIVEDHYAARAQNIRSYDAVSKDVISRWAYPLSPDSNLLHTQSYKLQKGNVYKEDGVILSRSCIINGGTVLGQGTSVGDRTRISKCVIGRRCQIGRDVQLEGAYIWDDTVIADGADVRQAIIANEAVVGKNCKVEPGALISYGVRIADGFTVPGTARLTRYRSEDDGNPIKGETDPAAVGDTGEGFQFIDPDADEEEVEADTSGLGKLAHMNLSTDSISTLDSEGDLSDEEPRHHDRDAGGSMVSLVSDDSSMAPQSAADFHHDATASLLDSLQKGDQPENIALELNGLRMATNASESQVRKSVVAAFMKRVSQVMEDGATVQQSVETALGNFGDLLKRTMFDQNLEEKNDQVDFMLLIQADMVHRSKGDTILPFVARQLHAMEVVEEEGFEQWWNDPRSSKDAAMVQVRMKTEPFVDYLLQSDDESDEDEDEESEEDE